MHVPDRQAVHDVSASLMATCMHACMHYAQYYQVAVICLSIVATASLVSIIHMVLATPISIGRDYLWS